MSVKIKSTIQWLSSEVGGRKIRPKKGSRFNIVWQKDIARFSENTLWTVEIESFESLNKSDDLVNAHLVFPFSNDPTFSIKEIKKDDLFELLDGYRVIGVGKTLEF